MRTTKILILLNCALALLPAQTVINGGRIITGAWDASQSAASKPAKMGIALPAACGTGEFFYLTTAAAGKNLYLCTSANADFRDQRPEHWRRRRGYRRIDGLGAGMRSFQYRHIVLWRRQSV
jgi:hypothetical protein